MTTEAIAVERIKRGSRLKAVKRHLARKSGKIGGYLRHLPEEFETEVLERSTGEKHEEEAQRGSTENITPKTTLSGP